MVLSTEPVPDETIARRQAGKPMAITTNALRIASARAARWSVVADWTDSDEGEDDNRSLEQAPEAWGYDGKGNRLTYPANDNTDTYAFLFELDGSEPIEAVALLGHNIPDLPGDLTVRVLLSDTPDLASPTVIAAWTFSSEKPNTRLIEIQIGSGDGDRVLGATYGALLFETTTSFDGFVPRFAELFLGRLRGISRHPDEPSDEGAFESEVAYLETDDGGASGHVYAKGRRFIDGHWTSSQQDPLGDDIQAWDDIYSDTQDGTQSLIYIPDPAAPNGALLVYFPEPKLARSWEGHAHAGIDQLLREIPPFRRQEEAGIYGGPS